MPLLMIHTIDFLHINMTLKCLHLLHQGFEYRAPPTKYPITITANYSAMCRTYPKSAPPTEYPITITAN
jgi:hypothetical protein